MIFLSWKQRLARVAKSLNAICDSREVREEERILARCLSEVSGIISEMISETTDKQDTPPNPLQPFTELEKIKHGMFAFDDNSFLTMNVAGPQGQPWVWSKGDGVFWFMTFIDFANALGKYKTFDEYAEKYRL